MSARKTQNWKGPKLGCSYKEISVKRTTARGTAMIKLKNGSKNYSGKWTAPKGIKPGVGRPK